MQKPDQQIIPRGDGDKPIPGQDLKKPRARKTRPELTCLPRITWWRRLVRCSLRLLARFLVRTLTRCKVNGLQHFPRQGPVLVVVNHLGDADALLGLAFFPASVEALAKMELYEFPVLGLIMQAYGAIWVHRGQPDRRALQAVLDGLAEGRLVGIAPEGRESLTGSLEEGTKGAAYIALKANVPLLPVTFTGTENSRIYPNLKKLRRTDVSITVGPIFRLEKVADRREALRLGTQKIMERLAKQLPAEYRGIYVIG
jgi:1-acyl-sn-glycerol-3-phosphate acyltransferase